MFLCQIPDKGTCPRAGKNRDINQVEMCSPGSVVSLSCLVPSTRTAVSTVFAIFL